MITGITGYNVWVADQDEALEFYVGKLGLDVTADVDLGFMRWLTVSVPGQPAPNLVLCPFALASVDSSEAAQANALLRKGVLGAVFLATDDCQAVHDALLAQDVEVTQPPTVQSYGIDCAVRDPFGNQVRIAQLSAVPDDLALATDKH
jgi:catechol 2,3-dioxygenase-like lactoylglutathione lyase family enzyme